jgi:DNA-binding transcriptional MerR regulator
MTERLCLIGDVARQLDVPPHRITYLFITRKLLEPELRLGNKRIFTEADVQRIAQALGLVKKEGN